jgi:hypothetical protein
MYLFINDGLSWERCTALESVSAVIQSRSQDPNYNHPIGIRVESDVRENDLRFLRLDPILGDFIARRDLLKKHHLHSRSQNCQSDALSPTFASPTLQRALPSSAIFDLPLPQALRERSHPHFSYATSSSSIALSDR